MITSSNACAGQPAMMADGRKEYWSQPRATGTLCNSMWYRWSTLPRWATISSTSGCASGAVRSA